jgi:hypothetical protein
MLAGAESPPSGFDLDRHRAGRRGPGPMEPCRKKRPMRSGGNARAFSASQSRSG